VSDAPVVGIDLGGTKIRSVVAHADGTILVEYNHTTATEKKFVGFNESATIYHRGLGGHILRDTAVYCTALRFSLPELQRLALRKQGLQTGIDVATILRSARFAYANTPASDSRLRAHYLALIIRSRRTFKRSGTMQMEMEKGGTQMFFDLFVAMCNHIDDVVEIGNGRSPDINK